MFVAGLVFLKLLRGSLRRHLDLAGELGLTLACLQRPPLRLAPV